MFRILFHPCYHSLFYYSILNDLITDQRNSETSINGILKVAKGDNIEKDPKACEKYPDSC